MIVQIYETQHPLEARALEAVDVDHIGVLVGRGRYAREIRSVQARITRPMLGFKSFEAAQYTLAGIGLMHMVKKGQLAGEEGVKGLTPAEQFYALAA